LLYSLLTPLLGDDFRLVRLGLVGSLEVVKELESLAGVHQAEVTNAFFLQDGL
jgi:hypothetical protein